MLFGTIESINNNINMKLKYLSELSSLLDYPAEETQQLIEEYELGSVNILTNYFLLERDDKLRADYITQYHNFITTHDFVGRIERIFTNTKALFNKLLDQDEVENLSKIKFTMTKCENISINRQVNVSSNKCSCGNELKVTNMFEFVCNVCGFVEKMEGTVCEDDIYNIDRPKHGSYDPAKHCRFWIERIQGRESREIPEKIISDIKKCIQRDKIINKEQITCREIRRYLSQTRHSSYNEHVPLIRKIITGISPPQLTDGEVQLINIYFDKVVKVYEEIKPVDKTNVPYHPYIIYKIIEHIFRSDLNKKARGILSCIHLQSRETLIENDRMWKQICSYIDDIDYVPTDRNKELEMD